MGVYLSDKQKVPTIRAWCVRRLVYRSDAYGGYDLDNDDGRLVGIAPEALSAPGKGASNVRAYSIADLQSFDSTMKGLEAIVRPELLEPFAQLRKKL